MFIESSKSTKGVQSVDSCFDRLKATFFPSGGPDENGEWQKN
jgi:hypothetical protein